MLEADEVLTGRPPTAAASTTTPHGGTATPHDPLVDPRPNPGTAVTSARPASTKRFEVPMLNRHQAWLEGLGFGPAQRKAKFVEEWVKVNHPAVYPYLKMVSDADSSKDYLGLGVKAANRRRQAVRRHPGTG